MPVFRVNNNKDYTVMSNYHLRDLNLSLKAKGLLSIILSLPDGWDYSVAGLVAICKEGNSAVECALQELKDSGYLIVTKRLPNETKSHTFEYVYDIYESPSLDFNQGVENQGVDFQGVENQGVDFQGVDFQGVENQPQLNTNKSITDKSITNKSITDKSNTKKDIYNVVCGYLNEKARTKYKATSKATQQHISARIDEGYTVDDFKKVIDKKCAEWIGTEFERYLRPETLFGTKFENYLNANVTKKIGANGVEINVLEYDDLEGIL